MSDARTVPAKLRWCVGKFVYPRGASDPLHFMELKRFIIDDAVDFSHLFYLRGRRLLFKQQPETDEEFARWMAGTAVGPVAEALAHTQAEGGLPVQEFYPGVGLIFEALKALRAGGMPCYTGCGPAAARSKFLVLHDRDMCEAAYVNDADAASLLSTASPVLRFYNHEQSIRLDEPPALPLERFVAAAGNAAVVAVRVTTAACAEWHTTVKGRRLELPAAGALLDTLRAQGAWHYRLIKEHDAGFLLPDGGAATGLLIAYTGGERGVLKGYRPA